MTLVGKQFPNLDVNAMNDMGDTFKLNPFILVPERFYICFPN